MSYYSEHLRMRSSHIVGVRYLKAVSRTHSARNRVDWFATKRRTRFRSLTRVSTCTTWSECHVGVLWRHHTLFHSFRVFLWKLYICHGLYCSIHFRSVWVFLIASPLCIWSTVSAEDWRVARGSVDNPSWCPDHFLAFRDVHLMLIIEKKSWDAWFYYAWVNYDVCTLIC